jgi:hypothetical protein
MVVCEVPLHSFEKVFVRITGELHPALALGDPPLPFAGRCHLA